MAVHTISKMPNKFKGRKARREASVDQLVATKDPSRIAGGDFNILGFERTATGAEPSLSDVSDLAGKPKT
jgi:hypothetical protein